MSWRSDVKTLFETAIIAVSEVVSFGAYNSQNTNSDSEETYNTPKVQFEYSAIGDGAEYLLMRGIKYGDRTPVEVSIHIEFDKYDSGSQDTAYDLAGKIISAAVGLKHECIHGKIMKIAEQEDVNHDARYKYVIVFGLQIKEFYSSAVIPIDGNPETAINPNPDTGRAVHILIDPGI